MRLGLCAFLLFAACAATQARPQLPGTFGTGETLPPPVAPEPSGALARGLAEAAGVRVAGVVYRGAVRHVFTHRDVTAELFRVDVDARGPAAPSGDRRWVSPSALGALGVSTFARKTVALGVGGSLEK